MRPVVGRTVVRAKRGPREVAATRLTEKKARKDRTDGLAAVAGPSDLSVEEVAADVLLLLAESERAGMARESETPPTSRAVWDETRLAVPPSWATWCPPPILEMIVGYATCLWSLACACEARHEYRAAFEWFREEWESARRPAAAYRVGLFHLFGLHTTPVDENAAFWYFCTAVERGHADAAPLALYCIPAVRSSEAIDNTRELTRVLEKRGHLPPIIIPRDQQSLPALPFRSPLMTAHYVAQWRRAAFVHHDVKVFVRRAQHDVIEVLAPMRRAGDPHAGFAAVQLDSQLQHVVSKDMRRGLPSQLPLASAHTEWVMSIGMRRMVDPMPNRSLQCLVRSATQGWPRAVEMLARWFAVPEDPDDSPPEAVLSVLKILNDADTATRLRKWSAEQKARPHRSASRAGLIPGTDRTLYHAARKKNAALFRWAIELLSGRPIPS
jgi:TPR repeat protein